MTPLESRLTLGFDEWFGILLAGAFYVLILRKHLQRRRALADLAVWLVFVLGWAIAVYARGYPMHEAHERRWLAGEYSGCRR